MNWFSVRLNPLPRTTTREEFRELDRYRRMVQRTMRQMHPEPPKEFCQAIEDSIIYGSGSVPQGLFK